jgi:hypothetical protein
VGYAPVFYASVGRYSSRVKRTARDALPGIAEDPTEVIAQIIDGSSDADLRRVAIAAHAASMAPRQSKVNIAVRALAESLSEATRGRVVGAAHNRLQQTALETLIANGSASLESVPLLDEMAKESADANVRVLAIKALGVNGTGQAAEALAAQLREFNNLQERGGYGVDNRIVRAVIAALGENGRPEGREELIRARFVGYASGVVRAAEEALAAIDGR